MNKNRRPFYPVKRHGGNDDDDDTKQSSTYASNYQPTNRRRRPGLSTRGCIALGVVVSVTFILFIRHLTKPIASMNQLLSDQPTYTIPTSCHVQLCNPSNRCSTWYPASHHQQETLYEWSDLVQQGIYRDLATVKVDPTCAAFVQVEDETPGLANTSRWFPIPSGHVVNCLEQKCRNVVALKIQHDILALLAQLESTVTQDPNQLEQEIVMARPTNNTLDQQVTLVSQFSVNRLDVFTKVIDAWTGPISIAIYLTEWDDIKAIKTFFSNSINAELYERITMTIVKPAYNKNTNEHLRYPINHLRNLAVKASSTPYVFVMDADFVPSTTLYATAQSVLPAMETTTRTAIVVPCFAMHEEHGSLPLPKTMVDVKKMVDDGIAYITDPGAGHGPTLGKEMALAMASSTTITAAANDKSLASISYEVCYESQWEPYYIVPRDAPFYDVRFKNQGGDKQSHALHLNAERYRFMVLTQEFMMHKDHAKLVWPGGGFAKAQKEQQSWSYFGGFMREMENHYGRNVRWPHGCSALAIGWQEQRRNTLGMAIGAV
ncbi:glycosyl-transferase for dystroglycan-domain-containing protein [Absidia repens]|uniref:Glycosyl-transferase for dystroglycan-domain-containing protein n=1 Tax=Absidia repens TaxID=90262 RepID=A0A1X2IA57_9FUNG|nr:glycosyl-transferase for dystroglycan-domain-containing protein [Absidia repens]